jgi:hypothetical protein
MVLKLGRFGQQIRNIWKILKCGAGEGYHTEYVLQDVSLTPRKFACPTLCYYQASAINALVVVVPPKAIIMFTSDL